jgi:NAD(P)-dependent dehydrogenase (short-subunit alcohol dehydrogenase family)
MRTVLITGSCQGLGLELCKQYASCGWNVLATCLSPNFATSLNQLARHSPNVSVLELDVADFSAIDRLAETLAHQTINLIICNAGINDDNTALGFGGLDYTAWKKTFIINTLAPVKIAEAFLTQLKRSGDASIIAVSSCMSSISRNESGGYITYRASKAALNAAMRSVARDLESQAIKVMLLHPGWVRTAMGGPDATLSPSESVAGMRRVIEESSICKSGLLFDFQGNQMDW